jgi:hypothetical protein
MFELGWSLSEWSILLRQYLKSQNLSSLNGLVLAPGKAFKPGILCSSEAGACPSGASCYASI